MLGIIITTEDRNQLNEEAKPDETLKWISTKAEEVFLKYRESAIYLNDIKSLDLNQFPPCFNCS